MSYPVLPAALFT